MKICGGGVTNWRESLGPHASCVHQLSLVHARCVRSQAPTANGSCSYFHRRHQDTKKSANAIDKGSRRGTIRVFCNFEEKEGDRDGREDFEDCAREPW